MTRARCAVALAGLTLPLSATLVRNQSALAEGTIWAECISGSVADTCQTSSWYTAPVAVVWHASPSPEETSPCLLGIEYPFESDGVPSLACTARWKTEGTDRKELTLHIEVSSPSGEAVPERAPDANGWYDHPVTITFKGRGYSGPAVCQTSNGGPTITYGGPDSLNATVDATCVDPAGKTSTASFALRYDATPPTITGAFASRPPDFEGWYNHPVTFYFTGSDALSGMEPCSATYAGPDSPDAQLIGSCRDRAGNVATYAVSLRYEAIPPALSVAASVGDDVVSLRWAASTRVEISRAPGLHGTHASTLYSGAAGSFTDTRCQNGVRYTYTVKASNRAGKVSKRSLTIVPGPRLLAPSANAVLAGPPVLKWTPVKGASYYNVQLYYRGHKVMSAWPVHPNLHLSSSWHYGGAAQSLAAGRYEWYVWPGLGTLSAARYGSLIGRSTFVFKPAAAV